MKKKYIKPQVYIEDFLLSENIAGNGAGVCEITSGAQIYKDSCAFDDQEGWYFGFKSCEGELPPESSQCTYTYATVDPGSFFHS